MTPVEVLALALRAAEAIGRVIQAAIEAGDVSTLEALAKVCPEPSVLEARDEALIRSQRARAAEALRRGT